MSTRWPPISSPMSRVLFSDNEFADLTLERELFASAGIDLVTAQCKT